MDLNKMVVGEELTFEKRVALFIQGIDVNKLGSKSGADDQAKIDLADKRQREKAILLQLENGSADEKEEAMAYLEKNFGALTTDALAALTRLELDFEQKGEQPLATRLHLLAKQGVVKP